jgi:dienelactone hydrolase
MQYDIARPSGWKPGARYPIAVVIPDATREFRKNLEAFIEARRDAPFILVAPYVVTSGGAGVPHEAFPYAETTWANIDQAPFAFDEEGLAAALDDVRARDGGQPGGAFLTGWEAGGHTVWALLFRHPEWFRAVVPVSTNYQGRWLESEKVAALPKPQPVVKVLFCDTLTGNDEKGRQFWLAQTKNAQNEAVRRGFAPIPLEVLPRHAHAPQAAGRRGARRFPCGARPAFVAVRR